MIVKILPYLLILLGLVGLFVSPEDLGPLPEKPNAIASLVFMVISLPLWGKILSMVIGGVWLIGARLGDEEKP